MLPRCYPNSERPIIRVQPPDLFEGYAPQISSVKTKKAPIKGPLVYRHINGALGEIRTPDPLVRSQVLYPAELRAHT